MDTQTDAPIGTIDAMEHEPKRRTRKPKTTKMFARPKGLSSWTDIDAASTEQAAVAFIIGMDPHARRQAYAESIRVDVNATGDSDGHSSNLYDVEVFNAPEGTTAHHTVLLEEVKTYVGSVVVRDDVEAKLEEEPETMAPESAHASAVVDNPW